MLLAREQGSQYGGRHWSGDVIGRWFDGRTWPRSFCLSVRLPALCLFPRGFTLCIALGAFAGFLFAQEIFFLLVPDIG